MKYIKTLIGAFVAGALLTIAASAQQAVPTTTAVAKTTPDVGPWSLALAGTGNSVLNNNDSKIQNSHFATEVQIGYDTKIVLPTQVGLRQSIAYSDSSGANWAGSSTVFADVRVVRVGNLEADAGGNVGVNYGTGVTSVWTAAPEIVARLYLKKDVDVFARAELPYNITNGKLENNIPYTLGLEVKF